MRPNQHLERYYFCIYIMYVGFSFHVHLSNMHVPTAQKSRRRFQAPGKPELHIVGYMLPYGCWE